MLNKFIPNNLRLDELIKEFPPFIEMDRDKLVHIISLLNEIPAVDHEQYENDGGWIPIHSTYIQKAGIRNFPKYKDWLIEAGVLETDRIFIPGEKATWYRFTEIYRQPVIIEPITKYTLIKSLTKKSKAAIISQKSYKDLYKWFSGLQIDVEAAENYLLRKYEYEKNNGVLNCLGKYNAGIINLNKIANKQIHFIVDKSAGRLHHNLTNLQSSLRNFLTYQGLPLVTIDIKNSQPAICTALLQPKFWGLEENIGTGSFIKRKEEVLEKNKDLRVEKIEKLEINKDFKRIYIIIKDLPTTFHQSIHIPATPIMLAELHQTLDTADVQQFIKVVSEGQLYEYMEEQIQVNNASVSKAIKEYTRKEIKTIMFTVFFTDNRFIGQKRATNKRIFKHIFPNVYQVLAMVKKKESKMLALMLQKLESMVVLDRIAKRISKECPNMPIYTIHDSITTTVGNEEYVQNVIKEEIQNAIGIIPSLSIEYWTTDVINITTKTNAA